MNCTTLHYNFFFLFLQALIEKLHKIKFLKTFLKNVGLSMMCYKIKLKNFAGGKEVV